MPNQPRVVREHRKALLSGTDILAKAAKTHPGVAELMQLYSHHAEVVRRASPYLVTRPKTIIVGAGSTTA